jgi:hypothetical protein
MPTQTNKPIINYDHHIMIIGTMEAQVSNFFMGHEPCVCFILWASSYMFPLFFFRFHCGADKSLPCCQSRDYKQLALCASLMNTSQETHESPRQESKTRVQDESRPAASIASSLLAHPPPLQQVYSKRVARLQEARESSVLANLLARLGVKSRSNLPYECHHQSSFQFCCFY